MGSEADAIVSQGARPTLATHVLQLIYIYVMFDGVSANRSLMHLLIDPCPDIYEGCQHLQTRKELFTIS